MVDMWVLLYGCPLLRFGLSRVDTADNGDGCCWKRFCRLAFEDDVPDGPARPPRVAVGQPGPALSEEKVDRGDALDGGFIGFSAS